MKETYTYQVKENILDLAAQDAAELAAEIEALPSDADTKQWQELLLRLSRDFSLSARYALMRFLQSHALGIPLTQETAAVSADSDILLTIDDTEFRFSDISIDHAEALTEEESRRYLDCLTKIASLQDESDPESDAWILARAWYDSAETLRAKGGKKRSATRLTKEEAFLLGHTLGFTVEEMAWFLVRCFDVAEGFLQNRADDLIEFYAFHMGFGHLHAQQLKEAYAERSEGIEKTTHRAGADRFTRDLLNEFDKNIERWKLWRDRADEEFLSWLETKSHRLDQPSKTAAVAYRNLAAFSLDLIENEEIVPTENEMKDCISDVICEQTDSGAAIRRFYANGMLSDSQCKSAADALLLHNKIQIASDQEDNTKVWHVLTAQTGGELTASGGTINESRTRVADLLAEKVQAEKSDMLYLLWFVCNLIWQSNDQPDADDVFCRVLDFMDLSADLLEESLLPPFYPPHPVEQSMLLSIVGGRTEENDPSYMYETMLGTLKQRRNRSAGSRRHSLEEKIEIVTHYRTHPELTLDACAAQFDVSPKSLSAWQKELLEKGLVL